MNPTQDSENVLLCTVGGSHEPVLTAVKSIQPIHSCFVCTGPDPITKKPGSERYITGKGNVIKAHPEDEKPTLPNIPTQLELSENRYEVKRVPSDDLDTAYAELRKKIRELSTQFPDAQICADYTGGTKSMSAALVIAALESKQVQLYLATGPRDNLRAIRSGTQLSVDVSVETVAFERSIRPFLEAWKRFAYDEAQKGLEALAPSRPALRNRMFRIRDLSAAFAAWDRFDHQQSLAILEQYSAAVPDLAREYLPTLKSLVEKENIRPKEGTQYDPKCESMLLFDLYRNAERRAVQGRYDDAVARLYRLIEWTAQWLLYAHSGLETGNVPPSDVPEGIDYHVNAKTGGCKLALFQSWTLLETKLAGRPSAQFIKENRGALLHHLEKRNSSILAHGFSPVGQEIWDEFSQWAAETFLPMLEEEACAFGIRTIPPQLPTDCERYLAEG